MRLLAPVTLIVAFLVLGAGVSAFGEPIVFDDGSNGEKLDIDGMTVTSNDDFILPHGTTEKYDDRYVVEVLDIDELIEFLKVGAKIEIQLRLESPELVAGDDYELDVFTHTLVSTPVTFTLPTIQEASAPEPVQSEIIPSEDDSKEIPNWVKDIFGFYYEGTIGDEELIGALQYLIKNKIIEV